METQLIDVTVKMPKNSYELGQHLAKFVNAVKLALKDGFQAGNDMPPLMLAAYKELVPAVDNVKGVGDDIKAEGIATAQAFLCAADAIVKG